MSQRLSRVDKHGTRQAGKSNRNRSIKPDKLDKLDKPSASEPSPDEIMLNTAVYQAAATRQKPEPEIPSRQRSRTETGPAGERNPSRKQIHTRQTAGIVDDGLLLNRKEKRAGASGSSGTDEDLTAPGDYPSRTELFPSHRIKWTRWFFNVLLVVFIGLTVWLFWWGFHSSPWSLKQGN